MASLLFDVSKVASEPVWSQIPAVLIIPSLYSHTSEPNLSSAFLKIPSLWCFLQSLVWPQISAVLIVPSLYSHTSEPPFCWISSKVAKFSLYPHT